MPIRLDLARLNTDKVIVIGGFVLNCQILEPFKQFSVDTIFIDINALNYYEAIEHVKQILQQSMVKVTLVGYSAGGLVALSIAVANPNFVAKLILLNSTPFFMANDNWQGISMSNFQHLYARLTTLSLAQFKDYFCRLALSPAKLERAQRLKLQSEYCSLHNLQEWLQIIATIDLRRQLQQLSIPTLFIYTNDDILVPHNNRFAVDLIKQHRLSQGNHVMFNQAELLALLYSDWEQYEF